MRASLTPAARQTLLANRTQSHGAAGAAWVKKLPELIASVAGAWSLEVGDHFDNLSYNYVAPCHRPDGTPAILKLTCPDDRETATEIEALRRFAGRGCVSLLRADPALGALLLQRLEPGHPLASLGDDAAEVSVAVAIMRKLHRPASEPHPFPSIGDWIENAATLADAQPRRYDWLDAGLALGRDLVKGSAGSPFLLHGDLHHGNILSSGDEWSAIDPKGVTGDPAFEIGPFLYNHLPENETEGVWRRSIKRRADQFADELGLELERTYACAAVYAVLSCAWSLPDVEGTKAFARRKAVMNELAGL